jgi:hypothetical protein
MHFCDGPRERAACLSRNSSDVPMSGHNGGLESSLIGRKVTR